MTTRRWWRSGPELALLVTALLVCCGFSLQAGTARTAPAGVAIRVCALSAPLGNSSAPALQKTADIDGDSDSADDDGGDTDAMSALVVAAPRPSNDDGRIWLLVQLPSDPWSPLPSRAYSLRAPPLS